MGNRIEFSNAITVKSNKYIFWRVNNGFISMLYKDSGEADTKDVFVFNNQEGFIEWFKQMNEAIWTKEENKK